MIFSFILIILGIILVVVIWRNIFQKAGYPAWYGFLILVPILNFIMLLYLAFSEWPIHREGNTDIVKEEGSKP